MMEPDPTNDERARQEERDEEWVEETQSAPFGGAKKRRCGMWSANYLRMFTTLLSANTVVLQSLQGYGRYDPIHKRRACALEHIRQELGMGSVEEVKQRINSFKKFAGNRLRYYADRSGANTKPEAILRAAPRWLRDLEPHLNLWTQLFRKSSKMRSQTERKTPEAVAAPLRAGTPQPGGGVAEEGKELALDLVRSARALRSLDARLVCRRVGVTADKLNELQCVWWRMLDVVRRKLALQRDGGVGGGGGAEALRFSPVEAMLADLLLLLDDSLCTLCESGDYDSMQGLVELFHLAQLYRLEEPPENKEGQGEEERRREMAAHWRRAHRAFLARTNSFSGTCRSLVLLQRRWHELKSSARRSVQAYTRDARAVKPCPLYASILKRFPHVVTATLPSWRELVNAGAVIEDTDQSENAVSEPEPELEPELEMEGVRLISALELSHYRHERTAKDEEDDLVLIEKEIETIDLINMADEGRDSPTSPDKPAPPAKQHYAFHDHVKQQLKDKRKKFANQLQKELDRQLKDIQLHEGVSDMTLLQESRPEGEPLFIYDSESDIDCTEDRNQDIEMIEETMGADEDPSLLPSGSQIMMEAPSPAHRRPEDDEGSDECGTIDEKLLMDARVVLVRIEDGGCSPLTPRPCKRSLPSDCPYDLSFKVKVERIDEESCDGPKGRQVKTMAKKLISEMMREESEDLNPAASNNNNKKKVQLPNIDEVRKNNLSMLTAQVAPLTTDGTEGGLELMGKGGEHAREGNSRRSSTDSSSSLHIDEGGGAPDDVTLSASELQRALARLDGQRGPEGAGTTGAAGGTGLQHCCTARRQRALNAARRRLAARSGRAPPALLDVHGAGVCAREGRCACCCQHLLEEEAASAQLQREADDIEAALRRLTSGSEKSGDKEKSNNRNKSYKNKKMSQTQAQVVRESPETPETPALDPLQEWHRQKTLNRQYFNLNLKSKPQSQSQPQPQPQLQPQEPNLPQPATEPFISIRKMAYGNAYAATYKRVLPSSSVSSAPSPALSPGSKISLGINVTPGNVTVVPFSNAQRHFNSTKTIKTSVNLISAPSKQLPRGTIVKLTSVPPAPKPAALVISTKDHGKLVMSNPNQIKIVPAASVQRKIATSTANQSKIPVSAANLGNIVSTNQIKLSSIVHTLTKQNSPMKPRLVEQRRPPSAVRTASVMKLIKIAPKPEPVQADQAKPGQGDQTTAGQADQANPVQGDQATAGQADQAKPVQGDQATAGQADQAKPGQGDQATTGQGAEATLGQGDQATIGQGAEATLGQGDEATLGQGDQAMAGQGSPAEEQQRALRGTGMKVIKISSSSGCVPVASSPRSLLRDPQAPASAPAPASPPLPPPPADAELMKINPNIQFKREDLVMPLQAFLSGADPTRLVLQCVDAEAGVLTPLEGHYVLCEGEPSRPFPRPTYWSIGTITNTARVTFEVNKGKSGAGSAVLDAPDKMCLDKKVYVKIKDEPLLYARVLFALRSVAECHEELVRDTALHFVQADCGTMCSLSRDTSRGPDVFALLSNNLNAAKALAAMLNQLHLPVSRTRRQRGGAVRGGAQRGGAGRGRGAAAGRADANARADVVMMMNNVNRKPIEMVYVDSDDEAERTATDFKGLEHFEELEHFDL